VLSPRLPGGCVVEQQRLKPIEGAGEAGVGRRAFLELEPAATQLIALVADRRPKSRSAAARSRAAFDSCPSTS
jgi:hypothetical protein